MYKRYVTLSEAKGLFFKEILRLRLRMTGLSRCWDTTLVG